MRSPAVLRALAALVVIAATAGCGGSASGSGGATVLAAASLTDTFPAIADGLKQHYPDSQVRFSFGGSSALAEQVRAGAPADVIATASKTTMSSVAELVEEPKTFARNTIVIAVPKGNPAKVTGLADFAKPDLRLVVCAPKVPCGDAATKAFAKAGVAAKPDSAEPDVRAVLTKVQLGEADAAIVYRTDAKAASAKVDAIELPADQQVTTDYLIAVVKTTKNHDLAQAFVDEVVSESGRKALADAGFDLP
jgi:molybdate transport system substrate-binding protein